MDFCSNCGKKLRGGQFCPGCGTAILEHGNSPQANMSPTTKPIQITTPPSPVVSGSQPRKKISKTLRVLITLIVILALAVGTFWILLELEIIDYNSLPSFMQQFLTDTQQPPSSGQIVSIDGMYEQSELSTWDYEEVLHYVYRSDVINFDHQIMYSYIEDGDTVIITVYNPDNAIRALSIDDTFVLGPTTQNPFGISGHVLSIIEQEANLVITASIPESLDEIFYEFEFVGEIDVLSADIVVADSTGEYHPGDFTEVTRNRTSMINWDFNRTHAGINVRGNVRVDTPRVRARLSLRGVDELVLIMGASVSAHASSSGNVNHVFPIGSLRVSPVWPVRIDIPVGVRVDASGNVSLDFSARADAEFGIRRNQAFGRTNLTYDFDFDFYGRAALSLNIQARAVILGIFRNHNVYGIEGDFGKGLEVSSELQALCAANECLVVRLFHVRRIRSLNGWGALGRVGVLQFNTNLPSPGDSIRFISNGRWLTSCPHDPDADVSVSATDVHATDESTTDESTTDALDPSLGWLTLSDIRGRDGVYIKRGERFLSVAAIERSSVGYFNSDIEFTTPSGYVPILLEANDIIVYVGNIELLRNSFHAVAHQGSYVAPHYFRLRGSSLEVFRPSSGVQGRRFTDSSGQDFSEILNQNVLRANRGANHGVYVLQGYLNQRFTLGGFVGTEWSEVTFIANHALYSVGEEISYSVERTFDGYFELHLTPPTTTDNIRFRWSTTRAGWDTNFHQAIFKVNIP